MRVVNKMLVDYDALPFQIQTMASFGDIEYSVMLISARCDIERTYGNQGSNYTVLVTSFEDGSDKYTIVPRDYQL